MDPRGYSLDCLADIGDLNRHSSRAKEVDLNLVFLKLAGCVPVDLNLVYSASLISFVFFMESNSLFMFFFQFL